MQRGQLVGETKPPYVTADLVKMMFGKVVQPDARVNAAREEVTLAVEHLSIEDFRLRIHDVNIQLHRGEVIGLAGMEGSGQRQFLRTLGGLIRPVGGKLLLGATDLAGKPYKTFMDSGVAYMPAARLEEGLISGLSLTEHFILSNEQPGFFINKPAALAVTGERIKDFSVKGTPENRIEALSGGNQQRVLLALLRSSLNVLLMEHPTRGLDIESTIWIWAKLKERCKQGTSIVFISSDLDEVIRYSDRILVFFGGHVSKPVQAASTHTEQLGQLIGGKGWEEAANDEN
jgi:simple sugar transport system ATP-binding protein